MSNALDGDSFRTYRLRLMHSHLRECVMKCGGRWIKRLGRKVRGMGHVYQFWCSRIFFVRRCSDMCNRSEYDFKIIGSNLKALRLAKDLTVEEVRDYIR